MTYTADFITQYQLISNVSPPGGGLISFSPATSGDLYITGMVVQATAVPGTGFRFGYWGDNSTANPLSALVIQPTSLSANFCKIKTVVDFKQALLDAQAGIGTVVDLQTSLDDIEGLLCPAQ
jgi:hypothetical protein